MKYLTYIFISGLMLLAVGCNWIKGTPVTPYDYEWDDLASQMAAENLFVDAYTHNTPTHKKYLNKTVSIRSEIWTWGYSRAPGPLSEGRLPTLFFRSKDVPGANPNGDVSVFLLCQAYDPDDLPFGNLLEMYAVGSKVVVRGKVLWWDHNFDYLYLLPCEIVD